MSQQIQKLIQVFSKLPGLGNRSARRIVLAMLQDKSGNTDRLINMLGETVRAVKPCPNCGCLSDQKLCEYCSNPSRQNHQLCVVRDLSDIWVLEKASVFQGRYHVIGGLLSALDGVSPEDLNLSNLASRIEKEDIKDITLALPNTIEGKTTAHYIAALLSGHSVNFYEPAQGVPIGGDLDYLDEGTLSIAFETRKKVV